MKSIKKRLRCIAYLLMGLMMLQSCSTYYSANVTLDEAVISGDRAKVESTINETKSYHHLESENGVYYGVSPQKGKMVRTPLDAEMVRKVQLKNKGLSAATTFFVPIVAIGAVILAVSNASFGIGGSN